MTLNIAVLVSGRGSNLQSIIDNIENGYIPDAAIKVVVSDKGDAYALERANDQGIDAVFIDPSAFGGKKGYEEEVLRTLEKYDTQLVLLAGYMRIIGKDVIEAYKNRMMNIHPALLPSFMGLHAQKQAFDYGVKVAGCTVHFVDEGMDTGPIILQRCVPVLEGDTEDTLADRILEQEHKIYPEAVKLFAEDRLKVDGRIVSIL
ncbi:formyltetrahydrofolate-dependent phosphoribosylglycinamide formyltransferase [Methanococcoides vulcani]|uniref:phosphoribosylglycinamide formyltransferase 1 n=1 Tax=Methanococcoides vulcani TaxID=1353158 RepID=A0A1H9Z0W4_9EURY|nr:phosphoribosylglycinamide formyltransferase [Methanococcoides vulcani]SES74494.1 formyltetrahydrofolate-dependent phosphoribosylglycinamide formyltransferase [Methanococcoides vulcani]